jgi:serine-type D-Ala-D-Ala carboxypeptidase/endopeptidase (penicillin-binding protein 4)
MALRRRTARGLRSLVLVGLACLLAGSAVDAATPGRRSRRTAKAAQKPAAEATANNAVVSAPQPLGQAIDREVRAALKGTAALGVHVVELTTGETVYAYNPDDPRVIASNTKLLTTATALESLGPGFFFETRFVMRGPVRDGVLTGDLGVIGGGDPNISGRSFDGDSLAVFRDWARELKARGVRRVNGDLYLATGLFEAQEIHPDWPRAQLDSWYEAPVAALSFNDNCILVQVSPGLHAGLPVRVETVPPVRLFRIDNTARTVDSRKRQKLAISRSGDLLHVSGAMAAGSGTFETWITVPDPVAYFGAGLATALAEEGIAVEGRLQPVPQLPAFVWERVAVFRSDLVTALRVILKHSQNFYAESVFKQLGARLCGEGSWRDGVRAVSEFLTGIGVPPGAFSMADGSGMSRENRFTPRSLTTLLRYMFFRPEGDEFARALPYAGEDVGSWSRRMARPPYLGNVSAKTGTLEGVSALSGYAKSVSGKYYAFSILLNRTRGGFDAHHAQDRIVMALIDNG